MLPAPENFRSQPLAARMRPRNLDEYAGQSHILAPGQLLRRAIEADRIQSLIFYVLLPDVESGVVKLIGATTHNPFFFVNSPLVSRSQIFELRPLGEEELFSLLQRALKDEERGLGYMKILADENALRHLARISDGDARKALNSLEISALTTAPQKNGVVQITLEVAEQSIQKKAVVYDGDGDAHYDTISAFIKSMRGSDPDAALYWLKMIHAGEDPRFIARRIVICAAEDVGLADPMALVLANACLSASEFVGWPEARIPLAEATIYIATANKSNSAYLAIDAALADVKSGRTIAVPEHLRDSHYTGAKKLGHGVGYEYAHEGENHFVAQDYLGADKIYYEPTDQGVEKKIKERVEKWRAAFSKSRQGGEAK